MTKPRKPVETCSYVIQAGRAGRLRPEELRCTPISKRVCTPCYERFRGKARIYVQ